MSRRDSGEIPHDAGPPDPREPDSPRVRRRSRPAVQRREIIADPDEEPKDDPLTRTEEDSLIQKSKVRWMGFWGLLLVVGFVLLHLTRDRVDPGYQNVLTMLFAAFVPIGVCRFAVRRRR